MNIYVCSPYRGNEPHTLVNRERNLLRAKDYVRELLQMGHAPMAPHVFYAPYLDDNNPVDRKRGFDAGAQAVRVCDELWVYGDIISEGMRAEIKLAERLGITVVYR